MERIAIMEKLKKIMVENLELQVVDSLHETDRLYEDLNIDSIMVLQLMVYIEEEFDVSIPEEELDPAVLQKVGSLISFIQELQKSPTHQNM